jgi:hypothetical protein
VAPRARQGSEGEQHRQKSRVAVLGSHLKSAPLVDDAEE